MVVHLVHAAVALLTVARSKGPQQLAAVAEACEQRALQVADEELAVRESVGEVTPAINEKRDLRVQIHPKICLKIRVLR